MIARLPVVLNERAISDIQSIADFIVAQGASLRIAHGFADRIKARCAKIGNVPNGGRPRDDLMPGLRSVPFERSAVIFYLTHQDQVVITNVFYGGRDWDALFVAGDPNVAGSE